MHILLERERERIGAGIDDRQTRNLGIIQIESKVSRERVLTNLVKFGKIFTFQSLFSLLHTTMIIIRQTHISKTIYQCTAPLSQKHSLLRL